MEDAKRTVQLAQHKTEEIFITYLHISFCIYIYLLLILYAVCGHNWLSWSHIVSFLYVPVQL